MNQSSFTILELISQSPTTSVYRAHQNVLDRIILLKILHKHLLRDKELVARFSREAKACALLRSENIVQVYDLTEVEGAPAIVMEYIEGKSLAELLEDDKNRSEDLLVKVAVSVLKALSYAHESGVTHRDIKPANILISEDGTIKVTDFGLATVSDTPSLTMEGSLIGTPAYMSPEQARGEAVDHRTDLFSLGVTLVEVLTGDKILAGRSYAECISKIQSFDLSAISYIEPMCSKEVFEFLKRLLAPNKSDRFASAREGLEHIGEYREGEDVAVRRARIVANRGLLIGGIGTALALVVGLSFVLKHPSEKVPAAPPDSARPAEVRVVPQDTRSLSPEMHQAMREGTQAGKEEMAASIREKPADRDSSDTTGRLSKTIADMVVGNDSGYISVQCNPWAKIFVDSEYAGTTPISGYLKVPAGKHTVMFNNPNFAPVVRQVSVKKNLLAEADADFLSNSGYLFVGVEPWGDVYVDDQYRETTPSVKPIVVSAGLRRIRIHNPSFQDIVKSINIVPGDTARLNFSFLSTDRK